jgi:hypothetical protein
MIKNAFATVGSLLHDHELFLQTIKNGFIAEHEVVDFNQLFCVSFLHSNGLPLPRSRQDIKNVMRAWFFIVSVDFMGRIAYNLSSLKSPQIVTNDKLRSDPDSYTKTKTKTESDSDSQSGIYIGHLEYQNNTIDEVLTEDPNNVYEKVVAISKCVIGQDWYQVMELYSPDVLSIDNTKFLQDLANAALQVENEHVANLVWNRIVKLNPQYK